MTSKQHDKWLEKLCLMVEYIWRHFDGEENVPQSIRESIYALGKRWDYQNNEQSLQAFQNIEAGLRDISLMIDSTFYDDAFDKFCKARGLDNPL